MPEPLEIVSPAPAAAPSPSPAAPAVPPAPPPAAQAAPVAPPAPTARPALDADAVEKRITAAAEAASKKAQADLLASLGYKDAEEAAAIAKRHREAEEAQKSETQRFVEAKAKLESEAALNKSYRDRLSAMISTQVESLTPEQRSAVSRLAGDDPLRIADALEVLRPTWSVSAPAPTPPANAQPAAPIAPPAPAPANAAPAPGAPPPAQQKSKWQEYEEMRRLNPIVAPFFYQANHVEIERTRPPATS